MEGDYYGNLLTCSNLQTAVFLMSHKILTGLQFWPHMYMGVPPISTGNKSIQSSFRQEKQGHKKQESLQLRAVHLFSSLRISALKTERGKTLSGVFCLV